MGRYIVKLKDKYLEWSTVVDAPITYGMDLDELRAHIKAEYGEAGLRDLPERLARVEASGSSSYVSNLDDVLACNRAGEGESELSADEIYDKFCRAGKLGAGADREGE